MSKITIKGEMMGWDDIIALKMIDVLAKEKMGIMGNFIVFIFSRYIRKLIS